MRNFLKQNFYIFNLKLLKKKKSFDGTVKFLLGLADSYAIEAVLIPTPRRLTACISTQAGCKFACLFCVSGRDGWQRNLSCGEMIQEVIFLRDNINRRVNNLVFMGVGEPLDNYDNLRYFTAPPSSP